MQNITFDEQRKLKKLGYNFIWSRNKKKALLLKDNKVLAKFNISEGLVIMKLKKKQYKAISKVNIREACSFSSAEMIIELYYQDADTCNEPLWCMILPEGQVIFE